MNKLISMRIQHFWILNAEAEEEEGDEAADEEEADNDEEANNDKEANNDATATATAANE